MAAPQPAHAHSKPKEVKVNEYAPTLPQPMVAPAANGSIFQASLGYAPLTSGARAAMVGDLVTIILTESTQAQKTNSASTDRSSTIGITPPTTGALSLFTASDASMGGSGTFKGQGAAEQSNQLTGAITVTIAQVFPNGTFLLRGEKHLTLNRGDEVIQISGMVRAADIDSTNSVLSTRIADAHITYTGKGEIARASTQGWLGRFFSRVSPF
ncbi:flagellar basal body L-ring protein FlgH [Sphingomonas abietis]|uniref:Flagellar L-ring protein n=2 Tax=Sphingomonas abietis TaxID=3012344 RepID=A0ABY7NVU0_9SPHN|nr:flagellar basal body L-ring protein FlgH [Sphingomonas abietis]WBO24697.1 flagellar basal body L-ring protein FlgH [Sphingomonas abietis]